MTHIVFGEDCEDYKITMSHRVTDADGKQCFETKSDTISNSIGECTDQGVETISSKLSNPLWINIYKATGHSVGFT
jgi:hypothetical protein